MRAKRYAPALLERGAVVIDNSATFRMRSGVPLIVPGVNGDVLRADHRIFPVANCTAIVLCTALRPIRDVAGLRRVFVATYQAASGAGRPGLDELLAGERAVASGEPEPEPSVFPRPLARNVVPQVGALDAAGWSGEERKVATKLASCSICRTSSSARRRCASRSERLTAKPSSSRPRARQARTSCRRRSKPRRASSFTERGS